MGACPDVQLLEDVLNQLCEVLHPREPSSASIIQGLQTLGGAQLFATLLQREQQYLRVLGLRLLAFFLPGQTAQSQQPGPPTSSELSASCWAATLAARSTPFEEALALHASQSSFWRNFQGKQRLALSQPLSRRRSIICGRTTHSEQNGDTPAEP